MENYETVSGLKPIQQDLVFKISSLEVERYFNDMLEVVVDTYNAKMAERCKLTGESFTPEKYVRVIIKVIDGASKNRNYYPFALFMPVTVDSTRSEKPSVEGELSMFRESGVERKTVVMKEYLYKRIEHYLYRDEYGNVMKDVFKNLEMRRDAAINGVTADVLSTLLIPRLVDVGNEYNVGVILDPLAVFSAMLSNKSRQVEVNIQSVKRVSDSNYIYKVSTHPYGKKWKKDKNNKKKKHQYSELSGIISSSIK